MFNLLILQRNHTHLFFALHDFVYHLLCQTPDNTGDEQFDKAILDLAGDWYFFDSLLPMPKLTVTIVD